MDPSPDLALLDLDVTLSEAGPAITGAVALALAQVGADPLDGAALRPPWTASPPCPGWTRRLALSRLAGPTWWGC